MKQDTGESLLMTADVTRAELERAFCSRLPDDSLRVAMATQFDAKLLWEQRNKAFFLLAANSIETP